MSFFNSNNAVSDIEEIYKLTHNEVKSKSSVQKRHHSRIAENKKLKKETEEDYLEFSITYKKKRISTRSILSLIVRNEEINKNLENFLQVFVFMTLCIYAIFINCLFLWELEIIELTPNVNVFFSLSCCVMHMIVMLVFFMTLYLDIMIELTNYFEFYFVLYCVIMQTVLTIFIIKIPERDWLEEYNTSFKILKASEIGVHALIINLLDATNRRMNPPFMKYFLIFGVMYFLTDILFALIYLKRYENVTLTFWDQNYNLNDYVRNYVTTLLIFMSRHLQEFYYHGCNRDYGKVVSMQESICFQDFRNKEEENGVWVSC